MAGKIKRVMTEHSLKVSRQCSRNWHKEKVASGERVPLNVLLNREYADKFAQVGIVINQSNRSNIVRYLIDFYHQHK